MTKPLRCAIYTRKSSEEGLEQDFNSLHAQREACEAYIKSQRHEGWALIKTPYDDGGISGGTMQRPALQRLLEDIKHKKIDIIVVYKVDRLTRSLADFARMVELFDQYKVSFVSVTQQFNTTSSMGRLTLNVLLSFAQFEREVTSERIRDKVKASKAKGIWMGGTVPLGYHVIDKKLTPCAAEVETVKTIFRTYMDVDHVRQLTQVLADKGIRSRPKLMRRKGVHNDDGYTFTRGALYAILRNPVYIGKTRHRDHLYDGQHDAIIAPELFDKVQAKLTANAAAPRWREPVSRSNLLKDKLFDSEGRRLVPTGTIKRGRRYKYYMSEGMEKAEDISGWRVPAHGAEDLIARCAATALSDIAAIHRAAEDAQIDSSQTAALIKAAQLAASRMSTPEILKQLVLKAVICTDSVAVDLTPNSLLSVPPTSEVAISGTIPVQVRRRHNEIRLVIARADERIVERDPTLIQTIAKGHVWFEEWLCGKVSSLKDIAERENVGSDYVTDVVRLAFLAPSIVEDIVQGRQPPELNTRKLLKLNSLPIDWSQQADRLGC